MSAGLLGRRRLQFRTGTGKRAWWLAGCADKELVLVPIATSSAAEAPFRDGRLERTAILSALPPVSATLGAARPPQRGLFQLARVQRPPRQRPQHPCAARADVRTLAVPPRAHPPTPLAA